MHGFVKNVLQDPAHHYERIELVKNTWIIFFNSTVFFSILFFSFSRGNNSNKTQISFVHGILQGGLR